MVSHKPRHRANCIDLLHSYLVNLALQVIKPPPAAAAPAPTQAKQPVEAGLPLSIVWLANAAVSVVQQVSFMIKPNLCRVIGPRLQVEPTGITTITISSCRMKMPVAATLPLAATLHGSVGLICRAAVSASYYALQLIHPCMQYLLASAVIELCSLLLKFEQILRDCDFADTYMQIFERSSPHLVNLNMHVPVWPCRQWLMAQEHLL